jgi:hypothetical protein
VLSAAKRRSAIPASADQQPPRALNYAATRASGGGATSKGLYGPRL